MLWALQGVQGRLCRRIWFARNLSLVQRTIFKTVRLCNALIYDCKLLHSLSLLYSFLLHLTNVTEAPNACDEVSLPH